MFSRSFGFEHVHLRLSGGGARVDSLSRVENDRLDEALVVQIAERLAGKAAVDLQALADARDRDELAGRDLSQQLLIASGVKVDSVLGLFLDLTLGPLLLECDGRYAQRRCITERPSVRDDDARSIDREKHARERDRSNEARQDSFMRAGENRHTIRYLLLGLAGLLAGGGLGVGLSLVLAALATLGVGLLGRLSRTQADTKPH